MKCLKFLFVFFIMLSIGWVEAQNQSDGANKKKDVNANLAENSETLDLTMEDSPITSGDFIYRPRGRRDPFWNILRSRSVKQKREAIEGIAGLLIDELELEGIILLERGYVAVFKGPDKRPYTVEVGDNVYDGEVIKIDLNTVVFKRILTIALGGTKEKIVPIHLIPEEEDARR